MRKYKGKNVLIVGLGKSGTAAFDLMALSGAHIAVYDAKDIEWEDPKFFKKIKEVGARVFFNGAAVPDEPWDYMVMSPGVSPQLPLVQAGLAKGARMTGDLQLAYEIAQGPFVAITGTNGKTTTTTLTGEMYRKAALDSKVTGNIGTAVISSVLDARPDCVFVTEVSSFQLETCTSFRPDVSAILNITPDHLDRHGTLEEYAKMKGKVFARQTEEDYLVYNADDELTAKVAAKAKARKMPFSRLTELKQGAFARDGRMIIKTPKGKVIDLAGVDELLIPGAHNLENALAASAIAWSGGVDPVYISQALTTFKGVAHRLEPAGTIDGVRFVNDSKGTNPEASQKAIDATAPNILLIAGGYDKHSDFHGFIRGFGGKVSQLILLGATAAQIKREAEEEGFTNIYMVEEMGEAVRLGFELAGPGDTVLLSPACASWGMYTCFEERGEHFKKCVAELKGKKG
ncbi:MAG: UDP-N-acetylmuramoyl-L-alanine--D-glutamate ligase [Clostridiales Family XIII bacterium]|nr:UDP-N-acetylmuramoyl-L-alanine--D-glutamate ligase [Clostridiales Family XIII bacterium]